jgi:hypothetical protein
MSLARVAPDPTQRVQGTQESKIRESDTLQLTKARETVDASAAGAIVSAYANLVYPPAILFLYVYIFAVAMAVSELFLNTGPSGIIINETSKSAAATKSTLAKALLGSLNKICKPLLAYQDTLTNLGALVA